MPTHLFHARVTWHTCWTLEALNPSLLRRRADSQVFASFRSNVSPPSSGLHNRWEHSPHIHRHENLKSHTVLKQFGTECSDKINLQDFGWCAESKTSGYRPDVGVKGRQHNRLLRNVLQACVHNPQLKDRRELLLVKGYEFKKLQDFKPGDGVTA